MKKIQFWSLLLGLTFGSLAFVACGDDDDDDTNTTPVAPGGTVDSKLVGDWQLVEGSPHHPSWHFESNGTGYQQFTMDAGGDEDEIKQIERRGGTFMTKDSLIIFTYKWFSNEIYNTKTKESYDKTTENYGVDEQMTDSMVYKISGNTLWLRGVEFKKK